MPKFAVDLESVAKSMDRSTLPLAAVKDRIEKVAFDVVRFKDGNADELWQIQAADDGTEYIVALYDVEEKVATASAKPAWSVVVKADNLHIFYRDSHVCKLAATQLGFADSDLNLVSRYLPTKLASNKTLVQLLLKSAGDQIAKNLVSKYPELANA